MLFLVVHGCTVAHSVACWLEKRTVCMSRVARLRSEREVTLEDASVPGSAEKVPAATQKRKELKVRGRQASIGEWAESGTQTCSVKS